MLKMALQTARIRAVYFDRPAGDRLKTGWAVMCSGASIDVQCDPAEVANANEIPLREML